MSDRLRLPDRKFNRHIGMYSGFHFDPNGVSISAEEFERQKYAWLPSTKDTEYLLGIMAQPIYEPGKFANYIAPPRRGINQLPIDFQYVRTEQRTWVGWSSPGSATRHFCSSLPAASGSSLIRGSRAIRHHRNRRRRSA